jgi:hypothetical protein
MFMANVGIYLQNRKKMTKLIKDCQLFFEIQLIDWPCDTPRGAGW